MKRGRLQWVFLVVLTWFIELIGGAYFIQWYWTFNWFGKGNLVELILNTRMAFLTSSDVPDPNPWTSAGVITALLFVYYGGHLIFLIMGVFWSSLTRFYLGVRMPGSSEGRKFESAMAGLMRPGVPVKHPLWMVADDPGMFMRWFGGVLVVDRNVFDDRYFSCLLAHELGHSNSDDRLVNQLFALFPNKKSFYGILFGLPFACGVIILYPFWMWFWRRSFFRADTYAWKLGQGSSLAQALQDLYLPFDKMTRFGRLFKATPYIAQRIHFLENLDQPVSASLGSRAKHKGATGQPNFFERWKSSRQEAKRSKNRRREQVQTQQVHVHENSAKD